jgi:hypothetical protein
VERKELRELLKRLILEGKFCICRPDPQRSET